jgi:hypothetical protein
MGQLTHQDDIKAVVYSLLVGEEGLQSVLGFFVGDGVFPGKCDKELRVLASIK